MSYIPHVYFNKHRPDIELEPEPTLWHAARACRQTLKRCAPGASGWVKLGMTTVASWIKRPDGALVRAQPSSVPDVLAGIPEGARKAVLAVIDTTEEEQAADLLPAIVRAVWVAAIEEGRRRALTEQLPPVLQTQPSNAQA